MGTACTLALPEEPQLTLPRDSAEPKNLLCKDVATEVEANEDATCCICLDGYSRWRLPCGHKYHESCLDQWLQRRTTCPTCGAGYGDRTGSMPDGSMRWGWLSRSVSGTQCRTIMLHFHFPTGNLAGRIYDGRSLHAYLPDDEQGRHLLALFQLAFRRRLMFCLSQSNTTGRLRPTFAVRLKTATHGGPARHGYPDANYYSTVVEELRKAGVQLNEALAVAVQLESSMVKRKRFTALLEDILQCACRVAVMVTPPGFMAAVSFLALVYIVVIPSRMSLLHSLNLFCITAFGLFCRYLEDHVAAATNFLGVTYSLVRCFAKGRLSMTCEDISHFGRNLVNKYSETMTLVLLLRSSTFVDRFLPGAWLVLTGMWLLKMLLTIINKRETTHSGLQQPLLHTVEIQAVIDAAPRRASQRRSLEEIETGRPLAEEDWVLYANCPSLQGRTDSMEMFSSMVRPLPSTVHDAASKILRQMLENELRYSEYAVFYHSYSSHCLMYELQTALAMCILDYPITGPPVMRLRRQPFQNVKCLQNLLQIWESAMHDQTAEFQAVAISAFCSCFASGGLSQNLLQDLIHASLFRGSQAHISSFKLKVMMKDILLASGLCSSNVQALESIVDSVFALGRKYGLKVPGWRCWRRAENEGHLMQIFIHASVVDAMAYGSASRGKLDRGGIPLSRWLLQQSPVEGHARLLTHPDLFLDFNRGLAHAFHYSIGYGPEHRSALLTDLCDLIKPHIKDLTASRASLGYERPCQRAREVETDLESAGMIYSI
mmetsp:Transcript_9393/g.22557  ORF Transcript_9393/g.22557 Transcript_9393/m.22557 type:complete len:771 (-) Transcript_9393:90-2402(-)